MPIHNHVTEFAGLPVVEFTATGKLPDVDAAAVAWRVAVEDFEAEPEEFEATVHALLDRVPAGSVRALVVGEWGSAYDRAAPVDLLASLAPRMPGLRALFLGELIAEECEISWLQHGDVTPLLTAYGQLEVLRVRGGTGLELKPVRHGQLRELAVESGGLPGGLVRAVGASQLPSLTHLELWLGDEQYGGTTTVDDLLPVLSGTATPALSDLALCNAEIADSVAAVIAADAPVVPRLRTLDLSKGTLSDPGATVLLSGQPLTHLEVLDLHHHYLSDEMVARVRAALPGVRVDLSDQREPSDWGDGELHRYTAVSE